MQRIDWADESLKQEQKSSTRRIREKLHQQLRRIGDASFVFTPQSTNSPHGALGLKDFKSLGELPTIHTAAKRRVREVYREAETPMAQQVFLYTHLEVCARPEGQRASSSALLCGPHNAQSSWRLEARGAGQPVIDHHSLPNYLPALALCSPSPLQ